jgi:hypothetical protein
MHLQRFTDADGLVWVHDRQGRFEPRRDTPRNVANERFLYAPGPGSPDPASDAFEDWLAANVDGPAAAAIAQVIESGRPDLDNSARSRLASYMSAQDLRTPKLRDFLLKQFQAGMDREWPDVVKAALEALGGEVTPELIAEVAASYELTVNKTIWLDFFSEHVRKAAERLHHMAWCTIAAPPQSAFILNDIGVIKFVGGFHQPVPYAPGWWTPITHWVVPLSSTLALGVSPDRGFGYATAKPAWLRLVNERLALDAKDYVFAATPVDDLSAWWNAE